MKDFLCQIEILVLKMLKLLKIQGFSMFYDQISRIFMIFSKFLKFQIYPGFQVKWQLCNYDVINFIV